MKTEDKEQKKEKEADVVPRPSAGSMVSFEDFDNLLNDFFSRRWPRLFEWNLPSGMERGFPRVDSSTTKTK